MKRKFIHLREAWYSDAVLGSRRDTVVDEVMLQVETETQNYDIPIEFHGFGDGKQPAPQFSIFQDSWVTLSVLSDVLRLLMELGVEYEMNQQGLIQPKQLCEKLKELGFEDATPRTNPYASEAEVEQPKQLP